MAFKLKSGNKPKFKEVGSSPVKAAGLADPEYHYTPDVPSDVIVGKSEAYDPALGIKEEEKKTEEVNGTEEGVVEETTLPKGTGEEYKSRKQRRAEKQYHKEQAKSKTGKITPEQRRSIKINKLKQKQTEARSKGTASYGVGWSLSGGLQEGVEPKADRLQRRIDKLEDKKPSSELSKTKAKTKAMKASRKAKKSKK